MSAAARRESASRAMRHEAASRALRRQARLRAAFEVLSTALALVLPSKVLHAQTRLVVLEEPRGTAVAVSMLLKAGASSAGGLPDAAAAGESGQAASGGSGQSAAAPVQPNRTACIAGRAVIETVRPQLHALGTRADVVCRPDIEVVQFSLLARPRTWRVATEIFLGALFDHRIGDLAIRRAKRSARRMLLVECGNPGYRLRNNLHRMFFGAPGRSDSTCAAAAVAALLPDEVRAVMRARFMPGRIAAAVAGPVTASAARMLIERALGNVESPVPLPFPLPRPAAQRHIAPSRTITAQIGVMLPLSPDPDLPALRLLEYALEARIAPGPARRDVYSATVEVRRRARRGTLAIYLVTEAGRAEDWAGGVQEILERLATGLALSDAEFRALLARYRGERLGTLATPERRALDAARQAFYRGRYDPPATRIAALTPERLRSAARSLGEAVVLIMRPES